MHVPACPVSRRHIEAYFGQDVPLSETRQMYLIITNYTAIHTSVQTSLSAFGLDDYSAQTMALGKTHGGRTSVSGRVSVSAATQLGSEKSSQRAFEHGSIG